MQDGDPHAVTTITRLRLAAHTRKREKKLVQFINDLHNARQIDVDDFGDPRLLNYRRADGGYDVTFKRNKKNAKATIVLGRLSVEGYTVVFKSWDPDPQNPLDQPPDGWKRDDPEAPPEIPEIPNPRSERRKRIIQPDGEPPPPAMTPMEGFAGRFLEATKNLIYGK
jgi:hypothetical protein